MSMESESLALASVGQGFGYAVAGCTVATASLLSIGIAVECIGRVAEQCRPSSNSYPSLALSVAKYSLLTGTTVAGAVLGGAVALKITTGCFSEAFGHLTKSSLFARSLPTLLESMVAAVKEINSRTFYIHTL